MKVQGLVPVAFFDLANGTVGTVSGSATASAGPIDTTAIVRSFGALGIDVPELESLMGVKMGDWTAETVTEARAVYKARQTTKREL